MELTNHKAMRSLGFLFRDIKISHSVFALPFMLSPIFLGAYPAISISNMMLLVLCAVCARTFAMGFNRWLDQDIDAANERTKSRILAAGMTSSRAYLGWTGFFGALFIALSFQISSLVGLCALPVLMILAMYSFMKRLSWLTHLYLGLCLGLSPMAVSIVFNGRIDLLSVLIGGGVALWTCGFDLIYSLQDQVFDRAKGLKSLPARFGHRVSIVTSAFCFVGALAFFVAAGKQVDAGIYYWLGIALIACVFTYEHIMIRDAWTHQTSKNINAAFFNCNASVSVIYFLACFAHFMDQYGL